MTLILTYVDRFGIVHASDSNLTSRQGTFLGPANKTFQIPYLRAGLSVSGCYQVGGEPLDEWMNSFIQAASSSTSLQDFAHTLKHALEVNTVQEERDDGYMVHIAGYAQSPEGFHPEFWFVRNTEGIDPDTGEYEGRTPRFLVSEDFWSRDWQNEQLGEKFSMGRGWFYVNGFPPGRISLIAVVREFYELFQNLWNVPNWKFRQPRSIEESEALVRLYIKIICTLFRISDYSAPIIGGNVQSYAIPQPE